MDANNPRSGWLIYMDGINPGSYNFRLYNQNGTSPSLSISSPANGITAGQWYHVVVVYDGTTGYVYINGQFGHFRRAVRHTDGFRAERLRRAHHRARSDHGFLFQGGEADVAIYTNALSAVTILAHYQAGTNGAPAPAYKQLVLLSNPLLFYPLDEPAYTAPPSRAIRSPKILEAPARMRTAISSPALFPGPSPARLIRASQPTSPAGSAPPIMVFVNVADASTELNILGPVTLAAWIKGDQANAGNFQSLRGTRRSFLPRRR